MTRTNRTTSHTLAACLFATATALPALGQAQTNDPTPASQISEGEVAVNQPSVPAVLYASTLWKKSKYDVSGTYRIERDENGLALVLGSDFATKNGPDLKVVLSPLANDKATGKNALGSGSVKLGALASIKGESRYAIPEGTDLRSIRSVLIHCEDKSILWAAAPLSEGDVIASGDDWTKKTNKITGRWEIASTESGRVLRFDGTFKTKNAPDLKIVLSPLTIKAAKNSNALAGGTVISPLSSPKGAQEYAIPESVDLGAFRSLLIHCEQYTKLWGAVPLAVADTQG